MIHRAKNRIGDVRRDIKGRNHFLALFGIDQMAFHSVKLRGGHIHARRIHGGLAMHQVQVAAIEKHQIIIEFFRENGPEIEGFLVKGDILLGALVGPHDGRIAPGSAESQIAFFNDGHILDTVIPRQKIGCGQSMQAAPDDNRIII